MIAIKDMEIPKSCWNCDFCCNKNGYYCEISHNLLAREVADIPSENRPTDCPLTEIITCNGCKYWNKDSSPRVPDNKEYHFCPMMDCNTADDFFCAEAKRRE